MKKQIIIGSIVSAVIVFILVCCMFKIEGKLSIDNCPWITMVFFGFYGFIFAAIIGAADSEEENKKNAEAGRKWVWDHFDVCDPDLSEGHWETVDKKPVDKKPIGKHIKY